VSGFNRLVTREDSAAQEAVSRAVDSELIVAVQEAADAQTIGAGLFLIDPPLLCLSFLSSRELLDQLRPLHARLDIDHAFLCIETQESIQRAGVDENGRITELLPAHRMPAACDADRSASRTRAHDGGLQLLDGPRLDNRGDARGVEL
jgi:hypothetical protein